MNNLSTDCSRVVFLLSGLAWIFEIVQAENEEKIEGIFSRRAWNIIQHWIRSFHR